MSKDKSDKRLIEVNFPLEQVSIDSVHEKSVRHGHISTLHIWPARRPLASCRAALVATLLQDPKSDRDRQKIYHKLAGKVVDQKTEGGVLHWGNESNKDIEWIREKIRTTFNDKPPEVLDPFSGGGAIPLEAMRLGCKVTAVDINPVAWFILKCTLEYPQKLSGKKLPLPEFAIKNRDFMKAFFKSRGDSARKIDQQLKEIGHENDSEEQLNLLKNEKSFEADFSWHIRAWGSWVLAEIQKCMSKYYPTYAEYTALKTGGKSYKEVPPILLEPDQNGMTEVDSLNSEYDEEYLQNHENPRWVKKTTIAYLWARTVKCKQCRIELPLLKTCWLAKTSKRRVLLKIKPNADKSGVEFEIDNNVPKTGHTAKENSDNDNLSGFATMSRSGATCPCCSNTMSMEDIRIESRSNRVGEMLIAVCVQGINAKEYRLPTDLELSVSQPTAEEIDQKFEKLPFGNLYESIQRSGPGATYGFNIIAHGVNQWSRLFSQRQKLVISSIVCTIRSIVDQNSLSNYNQLWIEGIISALACIVSRITNFNSLLVIWGVSRESLRNSFSRYALTLPWDFAECNPIHDGTGGLKSAIEWVAEVNEHTLGALSSAVQPEVINSSAIKQLPANKFDVIITDPPYYNAIQYSDLMEFFYIWLRRVLYGLSDEMDKAFSSSNTPKWDSEEEDGELIDDSNRFDGDSTRSKEVYEKGMYKAFLSCNNSLKPDGRLVVVFASKSPDAWETLVGALIRAGFVVNASWPIKTELPNRVRANASAALASSVWLVCKKRVNTQPGWDNSVLDEMREKIQEQLHTFWDSGIRGPDFVWAATGPALEAFSKYPVVKKANVPNSNMSVSEFLSEVRRLVVDFMVGHVFSSLEGSDITENLDNITAYYLLHRNDFDTNEAPIGACILYALSCNLSDSDLVYRFNLLAVSGKNSTGSAVDKETEEDENSTENSDIRSKTIASSNLSNNVRLIKWDKRKLKNLGSTHINRGQTPTIDHIHGLMQIWKTGDQSNVDNYIAQNGLSQSNLFNRVLQALIELSPVSSEERSILESLSNHIPFDGKSKPRQINMEY